MTTKVANSGLGGMDLISYTGPRSHHLGTTSGKSLGWPYITL